jgi:hypothetical protein
MCSEYPKPSVDPIYAMGIQRKELLLKSGNNFSYYDVSCADWTIKL